MLKFATLSSRWMTFIRFCWETGTKRWHPTRKGWKATCFPQSQLFQLWDRPLNITDDTKKAWFKAVLSLADVTGELSDMLSVKQALFQVATAKYFSYLSSGGKRRGAIPTPRIANGFEQAGRIFKNAYDDTTGKGRNSTAALYDATKGHRARWKPSITSALRGQTARPNRPQSTRLNTGHSECTIGFRN